MIVDFLRTHLYGFPSDSLVYLAYIHNWLTQDLPARGLIKSLFLIGSPQQPILSLFLFIPSIFLNYVTAYNFAFSVTVLLNFLLSYWAAFRLMGSKAAALFSALLIGSSLFVQWHLLQNIELGMVFFLPVFLLRLMRFWQQPTPRNSFFLSLITAAVFLTSFYLGYFALVITAAVFFFRFVLNGLRSSVRGAKSTFYSLIVFAASFFVLTLPATWSLWTAFLSLSPLETLNNFIAAATRNSVSDLVAYGARPWDYFLPSIYHPTFGRYAAGFYQFTRQNLSYQSWSPFLPERMNYLTWVGFGLAVLSFSGVVRRRFGRRSNHEEGDDRVILFLSLVALGSILLSWPGRVTIRGINFFFPSWFLFPLFPVFRVYARAGAFTLVAVSFLAGFGLKSLLVGLKNDGFNLRFGRRNWPGRKTVILTTVFCGGILFENLSFPPLPIMDLSKIPVVYSWLSTQPGNVQIAEYPKDNSLIDLDGGCPAWLDPKIRRDYNRAYERFYQTIHLKRVLETGKLSRDQRIALADLTRESSYSILKNLGIDYVLIHTREPLIGIRSWPYSQENPLDECWRRRIMEKPENVYPKFRKVVEFDDGVVYEVT